MTIDRGRENRREQGQGPDDVSPPESPRPCLDSEALVKDWRAGNLFRRCRVLLEGPFGVARSSDCSG